MSFVSVRSAIAAAALMFAIPLGAPALAADEAPLVVAQAEKAQVVRGRTRLKPGSYTVRLSDGAAKILKRQTLSVRCDDDDCGCHTSGCPSGEICVGIGICVPAADEAVGREPMTVLPR